MRLAGIVLALSVAMALPVGEALSAQRRGGDDGWVLLGSRNVTDRQDHDIVPVTRKDGDFRRIKLAVGRSAVNFDRVVVHFATGGDQEIQMRDTIRAGGESRAIDLRGGDRVIRSIAFWYEAKSLGRRGATVRVFGLK